MHKKIKAVSDSPQEYQNYLGLKYKMVKSIKEDTQEEVYSVVASKMVEDRDGEIVDLKNINLEPYKKNPVVLAFHDGHQFPIGKATNIRVEEKEDGDELLMDFVFAPTEEGQKAKTLWDGGFLNTVSIGFMYETYDGNVIKGVELLEVSIVPVPSNREAVRREFAGIKKAMTAEEIGEVYDKYKDSVNMTATELTQWSQEECSELAGEDRSPISRNLRLLEKNKSDWTEKDAEDANRTISFIARMKENLGGENTVTDSEGNTCGTKAYISLKNWAFDAEKAGLATGKMAKQEKGDTIKTSQSDSIETMIERVMKRKQIASETIDNIIKN